MDQTLIQEILEIVEQAAIASASLSGKGLKLSLIHISEPTRPY